MNNDNHNNVDNPKNIPVGMGIYLSCSFIKYQPYRGYNQNNKVQLK